MRLEQRLRWLDCAIVQNVNSFNGLGTATVNPAEFWFRWFYSGNFIVNDTPPYGRPIVENVNIRRVIVGSDHHKNTVSIAQKFNIDQKEMWNHLKKAAHTKKLDVWESNELTIKTSWTEVVFDPILKQHHTKTVLAEGQWSDSHCLQVRIVVC